MPAKKKLITLRPPVGGVVRSTSYQSQPPFTTNDALGVWPYDAKTSREMIAVRPGFVAFTTPGGQANMIASLNVAPNESFKRLFLVAVGGRVKKWDPSAGPAAWVDSTGNLIDTDRNVQAAPYVQQLFIATDGTPQKYDYTNNDVTDWTATTAGTVPSNCPIICHWAGRMVLAGAPANPHVWNMSRIDDPFDWLFDSGSLGTDEGMAVAGADLEGGQLSEPITALMPHNRQCILIHTAQSIVVIRGNPVFGGHLEQLTHTHGAINATAWCKGPRPPGSSDPSLDWTWFLTRDGLYVMAPGCGSPPFSISREQIPDELMALDGVNDLAYLSYDVRFRFLHIYVESASGDQSWHYFPDKGTFWPQPVPWTSLMAIGRFDPLETIDVSGTFIGGNDGLYYLDRTANLEGSTLAYCDIGPMRLAPLGYRGMLRECQMLFSDNTDASSGTVDWWAADSAEAAVDQPAGRNAQTTIDKLGPKRAWHPRIGGQSLYGRIKQAAANTHFGFPEGTLVVEEAGRAR